LRRVNPNLLNGIIGDETSYRPKCNVHLHGAKIGLLKVKRLSK